MRWSLWFPLRSSLKQLWCHRVVRRSLITRWYRCWTTDTRFLQHTKDVGLQDEELHELQLLIQELLYYIGINNCCHLLTLKLLQFANLYDFFANSKVNRKNKCFSPNSWNILENSFVILICESLWTEVSAKWINVNVENSFLYVLSLSCTDN